VQRSALGPVYAISLPRGASPMTTPTCCTATRRPRTSPQPRASARPPLRAPVHRLRLGLAPVRTTRRSRGRGLLGL